VYVSLLFFEEICFPCLLFHFQDGEIKALLSNQTSVKTVKFGGRPSSAGNYRSMAKPNSQNEPGPGQYIDPMREGRTANGEVLVGLRAPRWEVELWMGNMSMFLIAVLTHKPFNSIKVKAILSTQKGTAGVVFARTAYVPPSSQKEASRPSSAPVSRSDRGPPLFNLDGDVRVLSKYTNRGGSRWGPPGR
jgi:hypothetical protein